MAESSSFSVLSFCLFILFMGFSRQEYWSSLPFPSPVDHVLSKLSPITRPSWVALHGMAHSFIELDQAVVLVISLVRFSVIVVFILSAFWWIWIRGLWTGSWWWIGRLVCCCPWGHKESDMTECWTELIAESKSMNKWGIQQEKSIPLVPWEAQGKRWYCMLIQFWQMLQRMQPYVAKTAPPFGTWDQMKACKPSDFALGDQLNQLLMTE